MNRIVWAMLLFVTALGCGRSPSTDSSKSTKSEIVIEELTETAGKKLHFAFLENKVRTARSYENTRWRFHFSPDRIERVGTVGRSPTAGQCFIEMQTVSEIEKLAIGKESIVVARVIKFNYDQWEGTEFNDGVVISPSKQ